MFSFPFEDVRIQNQESFPINFRSYPVTIDDTSHLAATLVQELPADSGNFPWYMTNSIAVFENSYSEVVVNVVDLAWEGLYSNIQLVSNISPPPKKKSFTMAMSFKIESTVRGHHIYKASWSPYIGEELPPHFRLDIVYKMGGSILTGHYGNISDELVNCC